MIHLRHFPSFSSTGLLREASKTHLSESPARAVAVPGPASAQEGLPAALLGDPYGRGT